MSNSPALSIADSTRLAIASSLSPAALPIILGGVAVSAAVIGGLWFGASWLIGWGVESLAGVSWGWFTFILEWIIALIRGAAAFGLVWALFPLLIPLFISMFVNQFAARIEKNEYPDKRQGEDMPFLPEFLMDLRFSFYAIGLNILILPIYLIPGINLVIYYLLNAHLLGKQYFMMVARRHVGPTELDETLSPHRRRIYIYGLVIVLCSTIPFANLLAPIFATALMVHVFHRLTTPQLAS